MTSRPFARLSQFGDVLKGEEAQEPILAKSVAASLLEWLTEIWEAEALQAGMDGAANVAAACARAARSRRAWCA